MPRSLGVRIVQEESDIRVIYSREIQFVIHPGGEVFRVSQKNRGVLEAVDLYESLVDLLQREGDGSIKTKGTRPDRNTLQNDRSGS